MLPLVRRIIRDLLDAHRRLGHLLPEQAGLDRQRRHLSWPERCRRYDLHEEVAEQELNRQEALAELEVLGLTLLDEQEGRVGFPMTAYGRRAFLSWAPDDESLQHWHFAHEHGLRPIPSAWLAAEKSQTW
jgi:hypothetical protein